PSMAACRSRSATMWSGASVSPARPGSTSSASWRAWARGKISCSESLKGTPRAPPLTKMKRETFALAKIYVPVKRRATLDPKKAEQIAESILQVGLQSPILVRQDGERFVLVEGLHRLEACKQLGEETIAGYLVQVRKH